MIHPTSNHWIEFAGLICYEYNESEPVLKSNVNCDIIHITIILCHEKKRNDVNSYDQLYNAAHKWTLKRQKTAIQKRQCKVLYHNKITSISSFNHHWNTMSFSNNYQQLILEDLLLKIWFYEKGCILLQLVWVSRKVVFRLQLYL